MKSLEEFKNSFEDMDPNATSKIIQQEIMILCDRGLF